MDFVADEGGDPASDGISARPAVGLNPRQLRVSNAEREHMAALLQKALTRGLIDLEEFSTRIAAALAARTRAELNAVVIDLPGVVARTDPNGRGG